jgi:hypothetical protein
MCGWGSERDRVFLRAKQVISQRVVTHDDEEDLDDMNSVAIRLILSGVLFLGGLYMVGCCFLIQRKFKNSKGFREGFRGRHGRLEQGGKNGG